MVACAVDQDVYRAKVSSNCIGGVHNRLAFQHVGRHCECVLADFGGDGLRAIFCQVYDRNVGAVCSEHPCDGAAEYACAAGYSDGFIC